MPNDLLPRLRSHRPLPSAHCSLLPAHRPLPSVSLSSPRLSIPSPPRKDPEKRSLNGLFHALRVVGTLDIAFPSTPRCVATDVGNRKLLSGFGGCNRAVETRPSKHAATPSYGNAISASRPLGCSRFRRPRYNRSYSRNPGFAASGRPDPWGSGCDQSQPLASVGLGLVSRRASTRRLFIPSLS